MHAKFWSEILKRRYHSEDRGADRKPISEWILGKRSEGVDWIHLVQDRDQWRAVVNTVMNRRVHYRVPVHTFPSCFPKIPFVMMLKISW